MRTMILLGSALLVGGAVEAQGTAPRSGGAGEARGTGTEPTTIRERVVHRVMVRDSAAMNRATLGVTLGGVANKRDTLGVFVEAVAEDGPAERAGIYEGHRIAFINNVDVRASAADAGDPYLSSVGRHRLMRAMRDVSAGGTVNLRIWTGNGYREVQVTTGRYADVYRKRSMGRMFHFDGPAMSFAPAIERMRIEPSVESRAEIRTAPRVIVAPPATPAPRPMAPVRAGTRRYTI